NPLPFSPHKLPSSINTRDSEYLPSFSADGTQLIYTAVRRGQEDFYFSQKIDGVWQEGEPIIGINTNNNEGAQTISGDGRTLIFTGCNRKDGFGSCDLYISYKREDYWSRPVNMGRGINSNNWESQPSLSANGRVLFFASTRSGGFGKSDIYRAILGNDGMWSPPENLGPAINTNQDELGPFIHADGQTLYFVSNGHPGMGGIDLFKTEFLGDNAWDNPKNLGYPINTTGDESTLIVSLDGKLGYFASNFSKSRKTTDIYEFELPEPLRPKPVTYLKAKVIDALTKAPLPADVELYEVATEAVQYANKADEAGLFLVSLPAGQRYGLNVSMENYLFHSEQFDLIEATSFDAPYDLLIELQPIIPPAIAKEDAPKPIILKNIFFETASAALLPESTKELQRLYQLLIDNPSMNIQINGHTDDIGKDEDNLTLSRNRAEAVYNYLITQGIVKDRLSFKGYGESIPIESNDSAPGRQANRRTEFVVVQ
ncbi:MAG: OmpA family protein, partial [Bacteroidota bacterium]